MRISNVVSALGLAMALVAGPVEASFHLMKVVQVFPGTASAPNAQYVMIQMYSGGQNQVGGHKISVFSATNTLVQEFTFGSAVSNGGNQARILIATAEAQAQFGISADLTMTAVLPLAGGKVCFDAIPLDCIAWGNYSGSSTGVGTPFNVTTGLAPGLAAVRRLDIAGGLGTLEAADDTDDSANDFVSGNPIPRNNDCLFLGNLE
ncbi:MAG: hypothetical protein AB7E72_00225 [Lysobacterales bacterium]